MGIVRSPALSPVGAPARGPLGKGQFSPLDIPGLLFWHDPSQTDTVTDISGGASQVDDLSGNDYHMTQGTASLRPATGGTLNGLAVLDGDADDIMTAAVSFDGADDLHFWCVRTVQTTGESIFDVTAPGLRLLLNANQLGRNSGSGVTVSSFTAIAAGNRRIYGRHENATPQFVVEVDGAHHVTLNGGGTAAMSPGSTMDTFWQFDDSTGGNAVLGHHGEQIAAVVPNGTDMSAIAAAVDSYLAAKWGL